MTRKPLNSSRPIDSCTHQLNSWKPFTQTLDPSSPDHFKKLLKRPSSSTFSIENLDISKLSLLDNNNEERVLTSKKDRFRWIARKRRRRGKSVSGSDKSSISRRCCGVTGVDMSVGGTDNSSGEFLDANWSSDVSDAKSLRREVRDVGGGLGGGGEKDGLVNGCGSWLIGGGVVDGGLGIGNESGYGSEPGYRGDAELGYGDEFDEEEEDGRVLFWGGERIGDMDCNEEVVGENIFSDPKAHHRCRRKKQHQEYRMVGSPQ